MFRIDAIAEVFRSVSEITHQHAACRKVKVTMFWCKPVSYQKSGLQYKSRGVLRHSKPKGLVVLVVLRWLMAICTALQSLRFRQSARSVNVDVRLE